MPASSPDSLADSLASLMDAALEEAGGAPAHGDVPIGAVVARGPGLEIVAARHNERERTGDPSAHAELLALRDAAAQVDGWRLSDHVLVVTLEPCPMCAGAAWAARIDGIAFGASDPKAGAAGSLYSFASDPRLNHESWIVGGIRAQECAALLEKFFAPLRDE